MVEQSFKNNPVIGMLAAAGMAQIFSIRPEQTERERDVNLLESKSHLALESITCAFLLLWSDTDY